MNSPANDAAFCQELAQLGNPLFRLSHVFAGEQQELLTAVHAFFASIQNIGSTLQDEEVARRKIHWWQNECRPGNLEISSHPVLREFVRTGGRLDCHAQMQAVLAGAESRLENIPPSDEASFIELCRVTGTPLVDMERCVTGCATAPQAELDGLVLRRGVWSLLCESFGPKGQGRTWWLPLSLMARAGLSREDLNSGHAGVESGEVFMHAIQSVNKNSNYIDISNTNQCLANFFVLDALVEKRLKKLSENRPEEYPAIVQSAGISDLVAAWSAARKVNRQR